MCVSAGGSDAERDRLNSENEQLRSALRRTEAAVKQATHDAVVKYAAMETRCQVYTHGM